VMNLLRDLQITNALAPRRTPGEAERWMQYL
jgi:hypothetical protein